MDNANACPEMPLKIVEMKLIGQRRLIACPFTGRHDLLARRWIEGLSSSFNCRIVPSCGLNHREELRHIVEPMILLDLLTPPLLGHPRSYSEYKGVL
jgi:hypothetical protein